MVHKVSSVAHTLQCLKAQLLRSLGDLRFPDQGSNHVPCIARRILNHWTSKEAPPSLVLKSSLRVLL